MRSDPRAVGTLLVAVLAIGCSGNAPPPTAGTSAGVIPDLRGRRVMVLPVQIRAGVPGDASPEIDFVFRTRASEVRWIFSDELEAAMARAPAVETTLRGLPVRAFLSAEVRRIGDPLYGQLRRLGAMVDSDIALIPVAVRAGVDGVGGVSVVEIVATILNVRTGRVIWFGVVAGRPGPVSDFGTVASAVEKLAETLLWYLQ